MEPRAGVLIFCLLCVARTSEIHSEEITEFEAGSLTYEALSGIPIRENNETDKQPTDKLREKRALGLFLSGLAQIFGYTVTPIQVASLPNPNITRPAAISNSTMRGNATMQQGASSRPASMNGTAPRLQETIRFTGVLNFGNNSDIIGHLQRYEQIFHGRGNNTTGAMITPMPTPSANVSVDPRTTKAPLLAPFFVKIPLPIAPNLPPATLSIGNIKYPVPLVSIVSESNENAEPPVRKEQETVYRNNEDTERYTVEEKDIYDEKDVSQPASKYTHELYIDDPRYNQRQDEMQHKQQEHVQRLKEQNEQRDREKDTYYTEDESNERYRNREEEIANRNREYSSKYEPQEKTRPEHDDEEDENSAERYEEHANQANVSGESSKQPTDNEENKSEDSNENNDPNKQFDGYKYPDSFNKYLQVGYNQQLPIGDYFHESNPETIRNSYGEVLDNKKLQDDRLSGYFSMFKPPYTTSVYDSQEVRNPEDTSKESEKQTSAAHGYDEHLEKLQKLRDEYALPENKYEEYDINDESEADRNDRESERIQNRVSAKSKNRKTNRLNGTKDNRAKTQTGTNRNEMSRDDVAKSEDANSREEIDFARYTPLIVPVRYIDANDKLEEATSQRGYDKESDKSPHGQFPEGNVDSTVSKEQLTLPIGLPQRPQQLHEDERKQLHIWPPPFDYVFDNTEPVNAIVPPQNYPPNYQPVAKNIAANNVNNANSPEARSDYVVVVGNPENPYRYPYNIYYVPNEAVNENPHLNVGGTYSQDLIYIPQQYVNQQQQHVNQQLIQASPNVTRYNLNETARDFRGYYYQPQETPIINLDRYKYVFEERASQNKELPNVYIRNQATNAENWSNRIQRSRDETEQSSPIQLQNAGPSNQRVQISKSLERSYYSQPPRRRQKDSQPEDQRKDAGKPNAPSRQQIRRSKPFDEPQSTQSSFGFRKAGNNLAGESNNVPRIIGRNSKITKKSGVLVAPEPTAYRSNESRMKHMDEPEHNAEKANVGAYRNKVTTLRSLEHRPRPRSNGPAHYVNFMRNI